MEYYWSTIEVLLEYYWSTIGVLLEYYWSTIGVPLEYYWRPSFIGDAHSHLIGDPRF